MTIFLRPDSGLYLSSIDSHVFRPMMTACPIVVFSKCFTSLGTCHGISFPLPMKPSFDTATIILIILLLRSRNVTHCRVWVVIRELKMMFTEVEDACDSIIYNTKSREGARTPSYKLFYPLDLVFIDLSVHEVMDVPVWYQIKHLGDHQGKC